MKMRIVSRTIILNDEKNSVLLARNKGANFWYPPGGGWEFQTGESLQEAGEREVMEECGVEVEIERMLYLQEFHESSEKVVLEVFWLGRALSEHDSSHVDLDPNGAVEEVRWIVLEELADLKVFPKKLKNEFLDDIVAIENVSSQYILDK